MPATSARRARHRLVGLGAAALAAALACGRPPQQEPVQLPPGAGPKDEAKARETAKRPSKTSAPAPSSDLQTPKSGSDPVEDPGSGPSDPARE